MTRTISGSIREPGNLVVGYGSGGLAVIDPTKASVLSRIPLQAHPEGFQLDPENRRAFVNVPDARQVVVVDLGAGRQTASWPTPDLRANFPMALDAARSTVAVVFRNPARLRDLRCERPESRPARL